MTPAGYYPMPKFHFSVTLDEETSHFEEASGLTTQAQAAENREEIDKPHIPYVTLIKGNLSTQGKLYAWILGNRAQLERKDVTIRLLDETGKPEIIWQLFKAWPGKRGRLAGREGSAEIAIEYVELNYEEIRVEIT